MFCGKCGKEIDDGLMFCPECGAEIKESKYKGKKHKKVSRKSKKVIVVSIVVIITVLVGINFFKGHAKEFSPEALSVANNNLQNGGIVASDGKWIYYLDPMDEQTYKVKKSDFSEKQYALVGDIDTDYGITSVENDIYYFNNYGSLCKSKNNEVVDLSLPSPDGRNIYGCFPFDGKRFFESEGDGIYEVKSNSHADKKRISDVDGDRILIHDDYLYITADDDSLYRVKKDGTDRKRVLTEAPTKLVFSGDRMFYCDYDSDDSNHVIYSVKVDGSDKKKILSVDESIYFINAYDEYVFYIDGEHALYRMDGNGKNKKKLCENCVGLNIMDDMIYLYTFEGEREDLSLSTSLSLTRMNFDGEKMITAQ